MIQSLPRVKMPFHQTPVSKHKTSLGEGELERGVSRQEQGGRQADGDRNRGGPISTAQQKAERRAIFRNSVGVILNTNPSICTPTG